MASEGCKVCSLSVSWKLPLSICSRRPEYSSMSPMTMYALLTVVFQYSYCLSTDIAVGFPPSVSKSFAGHYCVFKDYWLSISSAVTASRIGSDVLQVLLCWEEGCISSGFSCVAWVSTLCIGLCPVLMNIPPKLASCPISETAPCMPHWCPSLGSSALTMLLMTLELSCTGVSLICSALRPSSK